MISFSLKTLLVCGLVVAEGISFPIAQRMVTDHVDHPHLAIPPKYRTGPTQNLIQLQSKRASIGISRKSAVYTVDVAVGTPPQMQTLLVDTGSSDVVIYSASSDQCLLSDWGCSGGYNPIASSTYEKIDHQFSFGFANHSNTIAGSFVKDDLILEGLVVYDQEFALVESSLLDFDIAGVLGLGFKSRQQSDFKYETVISNLHNQKSINQGHVFSLYLGSRHDQNNKLNLPNASLDLGYLDPAKYAGDQMTFMPCKSTDNFSVQVSDIRFINKNNKFFQHGGSTSNNFASLELLLDSGTIGIILPDNIADQIASSISIDAEYDLSLPGYRIPCNSMFKSRSSLEFDFMIDYEGKNIKTIKVALPELGRRLQIQNEMCVLDIVRQSTYGIGNILGTAFMSSVYATFDMEHHRVGLAQAAYYNQY
ncbi:aspartic peptidase domain-containing protein [Lipomyces japonicus]|uniref:aspartic peptidase domain-containing protein n=1 Tax=Lipomyces japonicus TaxID=56871 RepID=UPI0034CE09D3